MFIFELRKRQAPYIKTLAVIQLLFMRIFTILLLFATFLNFTTDRFEGGYLNNEKKEGYYFWTDTKEFIWFKRENDIFKLGRGNFEWTSDSITLHFGQARKQFDIAESSEPIEMDGTSVKVTFTDQAGKPIEGLEITLKKSGIKATTNENGVAILDTKDVTTNKDLIGFRIENYRTYETAVYLKHQKYQFLIVADRGREYRENQIERLRIGIREKGIILSNNQSNTFLQRVTKYRFMNFYHGLKK